MNHKEIKSIITKFKRGKDKYSIWIVANVAETVQCYDDFIRHASFSEFFTKAEFASIASAITSNFGYVRLFYSELEFISYVIENKRALDVENTIIYNFSRDGICEGKKSLIPAFCDLFSLNYIGSNAFTISLLRNKFIYSQYLSTMGIPVPPTLKYHKYASLNCKVFQNMDSLIVKNVFESASIGMSEHNIINHWTNDNIANKLDKQCEDLNTKELLVQKYIEGNECEVFVIKYHNHYHAFPPIKLSIHNASIITHAISDTYDYSFSLLSSDISDTICKKMCNITEKAAKLLNISTYARFDFRIDSTGEFFLIDIAGSPYLTRHSSVTYLFTEILDFEYSDIFLLLAALNENNYSQEVNCKSDSNNPLDE